MADLSNILQKLTKGDIHEIKIIVMFFTLRESRGHHISFVVKDSR